MAAVNSNLSPYDDYYLSDVDKKMMMNLKAQYGSDPSQLPSVHAMAESIRAKYGYSGGDDGSHYIPLTNQPTFNMPNYSSPYEDLINGALSKINSLGAFEYNPDTDEAYQSFLAKAAKMGEKAYKDNIAGISVGTGGRPNSWAATIASNAQNDIMTSAHEAVGQFRDAAYGQWQNNLNNLYRHAEFLMSADDREYRRFRDSFETEYTMYQDKLKQKQVDIDNAYDRTRLLGYVSNEDAQILGVPPGTPSYEVQERKAAMDDWLEKQKYNLENTLNNFPGYESVDHGEFKPSANDYKNRDASIKDYENFVNSDKFKRLDGEAKYNAIGKYIDEILEKVDNGVMNEWIANQLLNAIMESDAYKKHYHSRIFAEMNLKVGPMRALMYSSGVVKP